VPRMPSALSGALQEASFARGPRGEVGRAARLKETKCEISSYSFVRTIERSNRNGKI
jgi:hypothetical protein